MSRTIRIAAAQLGPAGTKRENTERMAALLDQASAERVDLLSFPELSLTPYFCVRNTRDYEHYFEPPDNPYAQHVVDRARDLGIAVVLPFGERDGIHYFNTAFVADREGRVVGKYRKVHIPGGFPLPGKGAFAFEKLYFTPGNLGYPVMDLGFVKVGVQICYDRNFPEGYRILALKGAEVIFTPTALMRIGSIWHAGPWELMIQARAYENGCFVVGINRAGNEDGVDYVGDSLIAAPKDGSVIIRSEAQADDLIVAEIDLDDVTEARKRLPFMRDRRPETYRAIVER
ncbi:MAG: carbon-nitrogen hydrolase family protein [Chloroflexi bacterium]|nr:carbon-nitrogen hydrolase family protein [Chloroflexota bacterium]